jgi:hypothetical protein
VDSATAEPTSASSVPCALRPLETSNVRSSSATQNATAEAVLLAVPGRGGVHRVPPDDEHAPDSPRFERFFTMLPDVVHECLVDGGAERVSLRELVGAIPDAASFPVKESALDVLCLRNVLSAAGCAALRHAVDTKRSVYPDSVDRMPEHQLDLSRIELEQLIGPAAVANLWRLPLMFTSQRASGISRELSDGESDALPALRSSHPAHDPTPSYRVETFVRRFSRGTRPLLNFHLDSAAVTVNVALSDDTDHSGGRLLVVLDDGVQVLDRVAGEATVHSSSVLHAVSAMEAGVRHSLIVFFHAPSVLPRG